MPQQRPPPAPTGFHSKSTPNLPTIRSFESLSSAGSTTAEESNTNARRLHGVAADSNAPPTSAPPTKPTFCNGFQLDGGHDMPLSPATSDDEASSQEDDDEDDEENNENEDEDEDEEEEEDGAVPSLTPRPMYQHHSRSNTYLTPTSFAPPFYNRPPTPLPPSPSLTSLLRPNFSSANSRPTTPDPSSDEGATPQSGIPGSGGGGGGGGTGTQTPNSAAASALTSTYRIAKPLPRASPRVPTYEYYGFTLYMTSSVAFIVYLLWAFLPSPFLHQLGIYDYPNRWWALAIPAWTVMAILYIYVALASYNTGYLTLPLDSVEGLVDEAASVAVVDASGKVIHRERPSWMVGEAAKRGGKGGGSGKGSVRGSNHYHNYNNTSRRSSMNSAVEDSMQLDWRNLWNEGTDAVMDMPIGGVCEILYGGEEEDVAENAHER